VDSISVAKKLLGLIERTEADAGEVYLQKSEGVDIEVRDQAVERLKNTQAAGYALRLIVDNRMAFVTSSDMRDESLERTVARGVDLARHSTPDESNVFALPPGRELDVDAFDDQMENVAIDTKIDLLKQIEAMCLDYHPAISKMEDLSYNDRKTETVIANTGGLLSRRHSTLYEIGASVVAEKDGEVENGWEGMEARFFDKIDPPSKFASGACDKAIARLGARSVETQDVPVIFDRNTAYSVLRHFFEMVNGERVATGVSMLKDRSGERIASDLVTIVDDPTLPGLPGSRPFDDEGTPSRRNVIVDRGMLRGFLFDMRTGTKSGAKSTGNADRWGFRGLPAVGSTNFFLAKGDLEPEEIIARTDRGLHVTSLAGWWVGINPATGDFSSGAKGFWIEKGKVVHPVKNVTIASDLLTMLAGIDAVGTDLLHRFGTAGPTFRVNQMKVGGA